MPGLPKVFFRENRDRHAIVQTRITGMGARNVSAKHWSQGPVQHEASPRPKHNAENGLALGTPHPRDMGEEERSHVRSRPRWMKRSSAGRKRTSTLTRSCARAVACVGKTIVVGAQGPRDEPRERLRCGQHGRQDATEVRRRSCRRKARRSTLTTTADIRNAVRARKP